ncbi:hypothetical protein BX616_005983, partial [Lobosporangium transversale]
IMTHVPVVQKTGTLLEFTHIDGNISIYRSNKFIRSVDGLRNTLINNRVPPANQDRILEARQWLRDYNPLFTEAQPDLTDRAAVRGQVRESEAAAGHRPLFNTALLRPVREERPRAADISVEEVLVAVDLQTQADIAFSNPELLPSLFPELYPFGTGAFALWHQKQTLRQPQDRDLPIMTIKGYAKYRILHFNRAFGRNERFIAFMEDFITKNNLHGYRLRTTPSTREGRATTRADDRVESMALPCTIRLSVAYKLQLQYEIDSMCQKFGTPETGADTNKRSGERHVER